MGQTLAAWQDKVESLIRDVTNKDLTAAEILAIGIRPAIAQYTIDRPRLVIEEQAGAGSTYLDLPTGWLSGFSRIESIEHPAQQDPPQYLDGRAWRLVRDPGDVTVEQILLDRPVGAAEFARVAFTAPWPVPTATAADDLIDSVGFEAVTALAASFCVVSLATQAARNRVGALPADITEDRSRSANLMAAATAFRNVYNAFLGLVVDLDGTGQDVPSANDFASLRFSSYDGRLLNDTWPRL